jgi:predicted DNA-binding protein YlxM (UPF0122 family)
MGRVKKHNPESAEAVFKRLYGVKPDTFEKMLVILQKEYDNMHRLGGAPPKLTVKDKLTVALKYLREYRTMESIGADYGVRKSTVSESIKWVEDTLAKDNTFRLPDKRVLKESSDTIQYMIIDATESPIQRPKEGQKEYYSGKKSIKNSSNCRPQKEDNNRCSAGQRECS